MQDGKVHAMSRVQLQDIHLHKKNHLHQRHRVRKIHNLLFHEAIMSDTLGPVLQWINTHPQLAGLATFGISTAESVAIIGTIIPGSVMMTAIGALAGAGVIPLWQTIFWAILGAIVGDGISYWIGRKFNTQLPTVWPFRTHPNLLQSGEFFFKKHGSKSVFIGRFVGPVRALVPLVAGMLGMAPLRFTIANILSAIGWAPAYMLPGILLGAASLELPPDVAVHVLIMFIIAILCIMLAVWLIRQLFKLIGKQIDFMLTRVWDKLDQSTYFNFITHSLRHHNPKKTYGQLTLAFYFLTFTCVLLYLTLYILWSGGSNHIFVNNVFFHLFRSLRTPLWDNIMLAITFLGEKQVLLPLIVTLFAWFAYTKRWYTAWHVILLGVLAGGGIEVLKHIAHSARPWGIVHSSESYSFPSGHTTLSVAFYLGIVYLLLKSMHITSRRFIYYIVVTLILAISCSRLYLGVHWFTDILGGWLLGAAVFMLVGLSYHRHAEKPLKPTGIIVTILLTLIISYSVAVYRHFDQLKQNYKQLDWPQYTITLESWWNQDGAHLPFYRVNRFGLSSQVLNVQWVGDLAEIQAILLRNGWEIPPETDLVTILHRIGDINSAEHLPLVSPLYLDKDPVLVLIKRSNGDKNLIVLRFWDPQIMLEHSKQSLWVGTVEAVPRTYSWIFKRRQHQITLTPELLFKKTPDDDNIKQLMVHVTNKTHIPEQPLILIKPKS